MIRSSNLHFLSTFPFTSERTTTHFLHPEGVTCEICGTAAQSPSPSSPSSLPHHTPSILEQLSFLSPTAGVPVAYTLKMLPEETLAFYGGVKIYVLSGSIEIGGYFHHASPKSHYHPVQHVESSIENVCPPLRLQLHNDIDVCIPSWNNTHVYQIRACSSQSSKEQSLQLKTSSVDSLSTHDDGLADVEYITIVLLPLKTNISLDVHDDARSASYYHHNRLNKSASLLPAIKQAVRIETLQMRFTIDSILQSISERLSAFQRPSCHVSDALITADDTSMSDTVVPDSMALSQQHNSSSHDSLCHDITTLLSQLPSLVLMPCAVIDAFTSLSAMVYELQASHTPIDGNRDSHDKTQDKNDDSQLQYTQLYQSLITLPLCHFHARMKQVTGYIDSPLRRFGFRNFFPLFVSRSLDHLGRPCDFSLINCGRIWRSTFHGIIELMKSYEHKWLRINKFRYTLNHGGRGNHPSRPILSRISQDPRPKPPTILIIGNRNQGKSTYAQMLINRLLNDFPAVGFLECDIGQTETTPSGVISTVTFTKPILSPSYLHPMYPPETAFVFGSNSLESDPRSYLTAIKSSYLAWMDHITSMGHSTSQGKPTTLPAPFVPLVINTAGWVTGLGKSLISHIRTITHPEVIIELNDNLAQYITTNHGYSHQPSPKALRHLCVAYDHQMYNKSGTSNTTNVDDSHIDELFTSISRLIYCKPAGTDVQHPPKSNHNAAANDERGGGGDDDDDDDDDNDAVKVYRASHLQDRQVGWLLSSDYTPVDSPPPSDTIQSNNSRKPNGNTHQASSSSQENENESTPSRSSSSFSVHTTSIPFRSQPGNRNNKKGQKFTMISTNTSGSDQQTTHHKTPTNPHIPPNDAFLRTTGYHDPSYQGLSSWLYSSPDYFARLESQLKKTLYELGPHRDYWLAFRKKHLTGVLNTVTIAGSRNSKRNAHGVQRSETQQPVSPQQPPSPPSETTLLAQQEPPHQHMLGAQPLYTDLDGSFDDSGDFKLVHAATTTTPLAPFAIEAHSCQHPGPGDSATTPNESTPHGQQQSMDLCSEPKGSRAKKHPSSGNKHGISGTDSVFNSKDRTYGRIELDINQNHGIVDCDTFYSYISSTPINQRTPYDLLSYAGSHTPCRVDPIVFVIPRWSSDSMVESHIERSHVLSPIQMISCDLTDSPSAELRRDHNQGASSGAQYRVHLPVFKFYNQLFSCSAVPLGFSAKLFDFESQLTAITSSAMLSQLVEDGRLGYITLPMVYNPTTSPQSTRILMTVLRPPKQILQQLTGSLSSNLYSCYASSASSLYIHQTSSQSTNIIDSDITPVDREQSPNQHQDDTLLHAILFHPPYPHVNPTELKNQPTFLQHIGAHANVSANETRLLSILSYFSTPVYSLLSSSLLILRTHYWYHHHQVFKTKCAAPGSGLLSRYHHTCKVLSPSIFKTASDQYRLVTYNPQYQSCANINVLHSSYCLTAAVPYTVPLHQVKIASVPQMYQRFLNYRAKGGHGQKNNWAHSRYIGIPLTVSTMKTISGCIVALCTTSPLGNNLSPLLANLQASSLSPVPYHISLFESPPNCIGYGLIHSASLSTLVQSDNEEEITVQPHQRYSFDDSPDPTPKDTDVGSHIAPISRGNLQIITPIPPALTSLVDLVVIVSPSIAFLPPNVLYLRGSSLIPPHITPNLGSLEHDKLKGTTEMKSKNTLRRKANMPFHQFTDHINKSKS